MPRDKVATLLNLLGELEGHLESHPDPLLAELRETVGAALAALHRANAEQRLPVRDGVVTRH